MRNARRSPPWFLLVVALALAGCGDSPPAAPDGKATEQGRPEVEGTFGVRSGTIREAIRVASGEMGWKIVSDESSDTEGVIEVESPAGQRVKAKFQSKGAEETWVGVTGAKGTPADVTKRFFKGIRDLVQ
jgi:hypothetical protein